MKNSPESLGTYGKAKWDELSALGEFDHDTLALLCSAWEVHLLARDAIRKHGVIMEASDGRAWNNPAVNAASSSMKDIVKLSKLLGLGKPATEKDTPPPGCA